MAEPIPSSPVHAALEQLLVLQDREQKIRQIQNEVRTLPLQKKHLEEQLATNHAALDALRQKGRQVEVDRKKLELDVGTRTDTIAKLRTQQYETRKNDEFQAMGNEIKRYEEEIGKIEDQELELMDQADKLKAEVSAEEKKVAAVSDSVARQLKDLESKGQALDARFQELSKERDSLASNIDEDILDRFHRLFGTRCLHWLPHEGHHGDGGSCKRWPGNRELRTVRPHSLRRQRVGEVTPSKR